MNAEKRRPWLGLVAASYDEKTGSIGLLCSYCRYCEWESEGEWYRVTYPTCTHPLEAVNCQLEDDGPVFQGGDCWGFRPGRKTTWQQEAAKRGLTAADLDAALEAQNKRIQAAYEWPGEEAV